MAEQEECPKSHTYVVPIMEIMVLDVLCMHQIPHGVQCRSLLPTPSPGAKFCDPHPVFTTTHRRRWSYQNAQVLLNSSKVHRESLTPRLSVDTSYLPKELCISIAVRVTYLCIWGGYDPQT
jgi:hypothetical protein